MARLSDLLEFSRASATLSGSADCSCTAGAVNGACAVHGGIGGGDDLQATSKKACQGMLDLLACAASVHTSATDDATC